MYIHFQIQPDLFSNLTKVILTNNGVIVNSKEVDELTKEKLLRAKQDLLNAYCKREYEWLSGKLNKLSGAYSQVKTTFINTNKTHASIAWCIQLKDALAKCLPQGNSTEARSAKVTFDNICAIIEHYEGLDNEEGDIEEFGASSAGTT